MSVSNLLEIRDRLNSPVTALPQGRCLLSSYWFHMSEIACSRVSSATPQRWGHYRSSPAPAHEETQPMPDGALSLLPAMPLCQPKERSQFRSHEVTWDSDSSAYPIIIDFLLCVVSLLMIGYPGMKYSQAGDRWPKGVYSALCPY